MAEIEESPFKEAKLDEDEPGHRVTKGDEEEEEKPEKQVLHGTIKPQKEG